MSDPRRKLTAAIARYHQLAREDPSAPAQLEELLACQR